MWAPFRAAERAPWQPAPHGSTGSGRLERLARLEQRLQAAEHVAPAAGDTCRGLRRRLELVVDDRELRHAALLRLDLPGDPARLLVCAVLVEERAPAVRQPAQPIGLQDLAFHPELLALRGPLLVGRALLESGLELAPVEVAHRELRLRDRVPHLLGRGARSEEHTSE